MQKIKNIAIIAHVDHGKTTLVDKIMYHCQLFRDNENKGLMTFGEGMKIGLAVSSIGGLAFAIYNWIFVTWVMPDFNEQYYAYMSGNEIGTPEFNAGFNEMMETSGFMYSKVGGSLVMFFTVFLIGLVISVISSMILKKTPNEEF